MQELISVFAILCRSNVGQISLVGLRNIHEVLTNLLESVGTDAAVQELKDCLAL